MLTLREVEVKKVTWTPERLDGDGQQVETPKLTLTLNISNVDPAEIAKLIAFASQGPSAWTIGAIQRELVSA